MTLTWIVATIFLLIIEMLSGVVACLCMAVGTALAIIPAACGGPLWMQVACCVVGIICAFIFVAPALKRYYASHHRRADLSNMDALIGRTGIVKQQIPQLKTGMGRVQIDGDNWQALCDASRPIMPGEMVKVLSYDSIVLTVKPVDEI